MAVEVPVLQFKPTEPVNLLQMIEAQARRLIEVGVHKKVGIDDAKFLDDAMAKAKEFVYSMKLANLGLNRVCLIHYGVSDRFLCEVGGVSMWSDPDKFTSLKGVVVPDGLQVIQCQFGLAHLNTKPRDFRANHHLPEIPGIAKEGLTAFLYWGKKLLEECNMDFPGSHSKYGYVPYLHLYHEYPALHTLNDRHAGPDFGSVARGSI